MSLDATDNLHDSDIHHRRQLRVFAHMVTLLSITAFVYTTYRLQKHNRLMERLANPFLVM